jgi:hypothetical protein
MLNTNKRTEATHHVFSENWMSLKQALLSAAGLHVKKSLLSWYINEMLRAPTLIIVMIKAFHLTVFWRDTAKFITYYNLYL